ncbi:MULTISPECIES: hypothetical protein [Carboxydothermus]|uniref:Iron-sulfur cluster-binding protein n=2 Tax=Carboxydothermus TaxID=129957 RepID=Q3AAP7_CARHZ|nr:MULTISPECIES: hypothetical protein [Carboxydothermus]ABB15279.1 iron-sulfur cluster-binding protein [Carboxydothermus hydrogenoformans Z-2901]NYE58681.1 Fe-S-cluster-containing hydrogenase component 2 [Carboxydothermus ferrireducens DSM 11255]
MPVKVKNELCRKCAHLTNCRAVSSCVPGALNFDQKEIKIFIKYDRCWNCRRCLAYCSDGGLIYEE